jgi:hypothetical protein
MMYEKELMIKSGIVADLEGKMDGEDKEIVGFYGSLWNTEAGIDRVVVDAYLQVAKIKK